MKTGKMGVIDVCLVCYLKLSYISIVLVLDAQIVTTLG